MKRHLLLLFLLASFSAWAAEGHDHSHDSPSNQASLKGTPVLKFIENEGQWEAPVRYRTDLPGGRLWLQDNSFMYAFQDMNRLGEIHDFYHHGDPIPVFGQDDELIDCHAFEVSFLNANPNPTFSHENPTEEYFNFFIGERSRWRSELYAYSIVRYHDLYEGIDAAIYSQEKQFKYDFIVQAGSNPAQIRLAYDGQDGLFLKDGDLHIKTSIATFRELKPYAYQMVNGQEVEVPSNFILEGNVLRFEFPEGYDESVPLVIDPTLVAASYSGSTATCFGHTATFDMDENIYSGGICFGQGFPASTGGFQVTFGGSIDHGINKYNPDATTQVWGTYIGGNGSDYPHSMFANDQNELIVLGSTGSSDFPTSATAVGTSLSGNGDITITHLNSNSTGIVGSTFLGGSGNDGINSIFTGGADSYRGEVIVDGAGDIFIASSSGSNDFPVSAGAFQTTFGGSSDGVVVKLNPDLSSIIWATYLGGPGDDNANGIKLTSTGEVYFTGATSGGLTPSANAYQPTFQGGNYDAYVAHLSPNGASMVDLSYLGTSDPDQGYFLEIDVSDDPYVLGSSPSYPVAGAVYSQNGGNIFITKLNPDLSASPWATTVGGNTSPTAFLVDICGNIYSSSYGNTTGLDFSSDAYDNVGGSEFYLCVLEPNASNLLYATSFGSGSGDHVDGGTSRFDRRGAVYQAVCTAAGNWPVTPGAVFPNNTNGGYDVVCFKFEFNYASITAAFAAIQPVIGCAPYPIDFINNSSQTPSTTYYWELGENNVTSNQFEPSYTYMNPGTYDVMLIANDTGACNGADTAYSQVLIGMPPPISLAEDTSTCVGLGVQLNTINVPGAVYDWSPGLTLNDSTIPNPVANPTATTDYTLIVTDQAGCADTAVISVDLYQIETDAGPANSFCEGEGGTQLVAGAVNGGTAPYYYTWTCNTTSTFCGLDSINDNDPIANPDSTTMYYLQAVDFNGCIGTIDSVLVEVIPKPIVDAGPDQAICAVPAPGVVLNATVLNVGEAPGPYTVEWFPAAGLNDAYIFTPYARPDTTTIYTCQVTSANGCTSEATTTDTTSSVVVTVHPEPVADAGPDRDICLNDSTQLQGLGYNAGPDYDFEWSPYTGLTDSSAAAPWASPPITTEYILTVWSNGCPSIGDTMTLNIHTLPTPSAGNIQDICLGETAQLDAFANGDSSALYDYSWWPTDGLDDPTAENPQASPDSTTLYYLIATSSWGCESALDSVEVTVKPTPVAEAGNDTTICEGDTIQLQGGYYYTTTGPVTNPSQIYYTWTPGTEMDDPTTDRPDAWPSNSVYYYLTVDHNTCSTTDSVLISITPQVNPNVFADTSITCEGDSVQLHALGGLGNTDWQWFPADGLSSDDQPEPMAAPEATTTYHLVADQGGCITEGYVTLEIIPAPEVSYLNSTPEGCAPFSISFLDNSTDVVNYVWDFGDGSSVDNEPAPMHIYDSPGTYVVNLIGINSGGCEARASTATITVVEPAAADFVMHAAEQPSLVGAPMELAIPVSSVQFNDRSTFSDESWYWDFGDGSSSDEQNPIHQYTEPGTYMVELTTVSELGCISRIQQGPIVIKTPDLFIPNVFSPNGDAQNDRFLVEYNGSQPFNLQIFDRWGVQHFDTNNRLAAWPGVSEDGQDLPTGTYYYQVKIGEKEYAGSLTLVR